ncbi:MAG TPA: Uma2 family endonuclease [Pyrinomonadaceae bacterium]|nr:Uma2 family endonuclease [Pyrinomonadaceae bacterium]
MIAFELDLFSTVKTLPNNSVTKIYGVSWEDYENLVSKMENFPAHRIWFDNGKLSIMSPKPNHEKPKTFFTRSGQILSEELLLDLEDLGSTTYKSEFQKKGAEPDVCFYVENAKFIIGLDNFDTSVVPPPDVVVEIDTTNDSWDKFPIYASFGVKEIWRYDGTEVKIYQLISGKYEETENSLSFPILTAKVLSEFVGRTKIEGQTVILRDFRNWIKSQI